MTCIPIKDGFLCGDDTFVDLSPFGAHVWMSWHNYMGPTFFRSKSSIQPIVTPKKKTWDAFGLWQQSLKEKSVEI
jgi:hypothetical protein